MTLSGEEFVHLQVSMSAQAAAVDQAMADLEAVDPAVVAMICAAAGMATVDKRHAAQALAIARSVLAAAGPVLMGL